MTSNHRVSPEEARRQEILRRILPKGYRPAKRGEIYEPSDRYFEASGLFGLDPPADFLVGKPIEVSEIGVGGCWFGWVKKIAGDD